MPAKNREVLRDVWRSPPKQARQADDVSGAAAQNDEDPEPAPVARSREKARSGQQVFGADVARRPFRVVVDAAAARIHLHDASRKSRHRRKVIHVSIGLRFSKWASVRVG